MVLKSAAVQSLAVLAGLVLLIPTVLLVLGPSFGEWTKLKLQWSDPCDPQGGDSDSLFDYMSFYACAELLPVQLKFVLLIVWLLLLISLLASTADNFFVPQLDRLSQDLNLSEDVAGVTLLALGNGMPDVMTATSAINGAGDFAMTMGEFLGAANFILMFCLGSVLLCQQGPTSVEPAAFLRDSFAYSFVLAFMLWVTWDGTIFLYEALLFFVIYAVYVAYVVLGSGRTSKRVVVAGLPDLDADLQEGLRADIEFNEVESGEATAAKPISTDSAADISKVDRVSSDLPQAGMTPTTRQMQQDMEFVLLESDFEGDDMSPDACFEDDDQLEGLDVNDFEGIFLVQYVMELPFTLARHVTIPAANWNTRRRRLAAVCPTLGLQMALLSFGGWDAFESALGGVPLWLLFGLLGLSGSAAVLRYSTPERRPRWHSSLLFFAFGLSIGWFNLLANECVAVLETFGLNFGISSSVLGITVLAMGNSVGDLVADTALARQGKSRTAVAGCFGSPLLSDVLGLGVALTSYTLSHGPLRVRLSLQNKFTAGFCVVSVICTTVTFILFKFSCPRWFAYVLYGVYGLSLLVSVLIETGIVHD